jgi:formylglycine-generating enzyme required for sulfatase activity
MTTPRPLRVFICHSSNDKPAILELYQKLRAEPWIQPWLDEEELHPGQTWEIEIEKAVEASDVILVCLSNNSINKRGFVQRELRFALDVALEIPEAEIFIIPLRLEECTPPRSLREWQYADYFPETQRERALQRLLISLEKRASLLDIKIETKIKEPSATLNYGGMELMYVPAGEFTMGSNIDIKDLIVHDREAPKCVVNLPYDYWLARYPVTNAQYNVYVKAKGIEHPVPDWQRKKNHPVCDVTWGDAMEYCKWLNNLVRDELPNGLVLRLPTEAEWEKAARGTDEREYPWGNTFDPDKCHSSENAKLIIEKLEALGTTPVDYYSPRGDSPYGCADMAGNSYDWTHSKFENYPYNASDGREDDELNAWRVLRGGSWIDSYYVVRSSVREFSLPDLGFEEYYGFRVCLAPPIPK